MSNKMIRQETKLYVEHALHITPKLLQSLQILQMDSQSLEAYVEEQFKENTVLEYIHPVKDLAEQWLLPRISSTEDEDWCQEIPEKKIPFETLEFFLNDQLERQQLTDELMQSCRMLVMLLDDQGYLRMEQIADFLDDEAFLQALTVIQSLEPPGVGARSLEECLLLQLQRKGGSNLAADLVEKYLEDIAQHNYQKIARLCGKTRKEIENAVSEILKLNPRPCGGYTNGERVSYIWPDFYITAKEGQIFVERNLRSFPQICINEYYTELANNSTDEQVQNYLKEKLAAAKTLIINLEQRGNTVERCLQVILEAQKDFFFGSSRQLRPLLQEDVARVLGIQISTVSRAISGKYLEFAGKIYPIKHFFARPAVGTFQQQVSTAQIKALIREIIENEDASMPVSDQKIVELLRKGGSDISRRAVAKYRDEMHIPSSRQRRKI